MLTIKLLGTPDFQTFLRPSIKYTWYTWHFLFIQPRTVSTLYKQAETSRSRSIYQIPTSYSLHTSFKSVLI